MIGQEKYEKTEHSKVKCFLFIPQETEVHTIPKTQSMGIVNFLHVPHSSISRVIETHTNPKTWENWVLIVRETYEKTQKFQSYRTLSYFMRGINPYNFKNMGNVNSHSKEKIWENTNITNLRVSYIFQLKQKSKQFPKHGKSKFP